MLSRLTLRVASPEQKKSIVKIAAHVSGNSHIGWDGLVVPPGASEQKLAVRKQFRRCEEKLLDPRLAVGKTISEKAQIAPVCRPGRDRIMRLRVDCVVDWHAASRAELPIARNDRIAASIGEHEIVTRDRGPQMMLLVGDHTVERRWSVHVPINSDQRRTGDL